MLAMTKFQLSEELIQSALTFFPKGLVAIDLETTGLSPFSDKIIEIAAVKINSTGEIETYQQLINPEIPIPSFSTDIHKITNEMVAQSEIIAEVLPGFIQFVQDQTIIAHNAQFDLGFLINQVHKTGLTFAENNIYCSVKLSRSLGLPVENHKLSTLADYFSAPLESHHRALDDSFACLFISCCAMNMIEKKGRLNSVKDKAYLFNLSEFKRDKDFSLPEIFQDLVARLPEQPVVEMDYKSKNKNSEFEGTIRHVRAVGILPMPQGLMLHGQCLRSGGYKSFNIKRIKFIKILSPEGQEYWKKIGNDLDAKHFAIRQEELDKKKNKDCD